MAPQRRETDEASSTAWVGRYVGPLLQLFTLVAFILGALQVWIATKFVTKDEMEKLRVSLEHNHADHMDDYRQIKQGVDELQALMRERNPRPKHGSGSRGGDE